MVEKELALETAFGYGLINHDWLESLWIVNHTLYIQLQCDSSPVHYQGTTKKQTETTTGPIEIQMLIKLVQQKAWNDINPTVFILRTSPCLSADDEDARALLSHRWKALYVDVVNQSRFVFFFTPSSFFSSLWRYRLFTSPLHLCPRMHMTTQLVNTYLQSINT